MLFYYLFILLFHKSVTNHITYQIFVPFIFSKVIGDASATRQKISPERTDRNDRGGNRSDKMNSQERDRSERSDRNEKKIGAKNSDSINSNNNNSNSSSNRNRSISSSRRGQEEDDEEEEESSSNAAREKERDSKRYKGIRGFFRRLFD